MAEHFEDPFENKPEAEQKVSSGSPNTSYKKASLGKRLVNVVVDGMAISLIGGLLFSTTENMFVSGLITIAYYIYLEHTRGQTLGKMLTNTKVIGADGSKPELSMIALRTLVRFIPIEWISFFLTDDETGWHDRWSETRVVEI